MSSSRVNLSRCLIPLDEIQLATQNFSPELLIGSGGCGNVYKGQLSEHWQNRTAAFKKLTPDSLLGESVLRNELEMMSSFNDENIIPFIGYCDEDGEITVVSEYANNQSLDQHLGNPDKRRSLTWTQRLKICIRAAKGLEYLHSGLGEGRVVIHRNFKSSKILLDENLEAKIGGFTLAITINQNVQSQVYDNIAGTECYLDPIYQESSIVNTESDVYSFGIVLFEMLSGMLAFTERRIGEGQPQKLINFVRRYYHDGLESLIDSHIRDQMNLRSFNVFKEIAYRCISWKSNGRPTMNMIIKSIVQALDIQTNQVDSTNAILSGNKHQNLESFLVPLKEINLATNDFSQNTCSGTDGFAVVYTGQLSEHWQNRTADFKRYHDTCQSQFRNELHFISFFDHQNITRFIGYCEEDNEMIIIYENAVNESLDNHLDDTTRICQLTWTQRLKICREVAKGLEYLHSGLGEYVKVIHRDIKSKNILLHENLEAKICNFSLSLLVNRNQLEVCDLVAGTAFYMDPVYRESEIVSTESDVYSFGVVLFEMLCGMTVYSERSIDDGDRPQTLITLIRRYHDDGLEKLIDAHIRDEIDIHSLNAFKKIAYRCISLELKDRPTIKRVIRRVEEALHIQNRGAVSTITTRTLTSYLIPLEEINLATGKFNPETRIGEGGFGVVYKGQLSQRWGNCIVAIKCLNPEGHQGKKEFHNELNLISKFHHPNIITFIGYCDEGDQMIIVYDYAANRSLDYFMDNPKNMGVLTWTKRLNICLGAAKGLDYLHSGLGKDHRVIHRDVKSGNILLDEMLEAKICDFGLSTEGPRNKKQTEVFTKVVGTSFYTDPIYSGSGILRKESDVYSFGVVLFEMLSGRLAYRLTDFVDGNPQYLINLVRYYYESGSEKLIDPKIRDHIDSRSFDTFKQIAYQCISFVSRERPTMETIIDKIEDAIDFQELKDAVR